MMRNNNFFLGYYLLHMIKYFLTETVFWKGVNKYLLRHSYANAIQDDLWHSLTEAAHEMRVLDTEVTVKTIMDTWTLTAGYPLVTVRRDYKNRTIAITQVIFCVFFYFLFFSPFVYQFRLC